MSKRIKWGAVALLTAVVCMGVAELLAVSPAFAGPQCWQVDCNTCCRGKGGVICTQRACP